jgi:hypothetical protein
MAVCLIVGGLAFSASADLVGLWRFEEGSGTSAVDSSGNGHTGTLGGYSYNGTEYVSDITAAPTRVDGHGGGEALAFSPTYANDWTRPYVTVTDPAGVDSNLNLTGSFSVAFWAWFNSSPVGTENVTLFAKDASYTILAPKVWNGHKDFWLWDNNYLDPPNPGIQQELDAVDAVSTGGWVHIAMTYDFSTTTSKLYINGVENDSQLGSDTGTFAYPASASDLIIGHDPFDTDTTWERDFSGKMDDVAMFDEALTADQVGTIMGGDFSAFLPAQGAQRIVSKPAPGFIEEGGLLTLTAPAGALSYQWRFDDGDMSDTTDGRITGVNSRVLVFLPVTTDDEGTYTCRYDTGSGKEIFTTPAFELDVLPAGSLPVAGIIGLALLAASTAWGGAVAIRRKKH